MANLNALAGVFMYVKVLHTVTNSVKVKSKRFVQIVSNNLVNRIKTRYLQRWNLMLESDWR